MRLVTLLIVFFVFVILPAILERLAKRRLLQGREEPDDAPAQAPAEEGSGYAAGEGEIGRYLESIGIKVERRAPQPPTAEPVQGPQAPPPHRQPAATQAGPAGPTRVVETHPERVGVRVQRRAPEQPRVRILPPKPRPVPTPARVEEAAIAAGSHLHFALGGEVPNEDVTPDAAASAPPAPARLPLGVLGGRPAPADLQRAIILAEIVRRPDFERLPIDRELL